MTMSLTLLSSTISIFILIYITYQRYFSCLSSIPGPFGASISKWWLIKHTRRGDFHRQVVRLHDTYGPLVRIAPNEISIIDPLTIKKIYGAGSKFRKAEWYDVLQGGRKFDLFGEQDIAVHASQRRLVSRIYAMETLKDLEPYVEATIQRFMAKIKQMLDDKKAIDVDIGKWLQLFAFDVIGEVTFSQPFGFLDAQEDDGIFSRIHKSVASGVWLGHVRWILSLHNSLMPILGNYLAINDKEGFVRDYTIRQVNSRMERGSDRPDILGKLFAVHEEKPSALSMANITSVCSSNVGAGSDTTAISLRAILWFLLTNPEKKAKLLHEIDATAWEFGVIEAFDYQRSMRMPYLQAVIYEALRLYPAIGMALPRIVPPDGLSVGEKFIPGGAVVSTSAWALHRNQEIFGDDVENFRPERWLEEKTGGMRMSIGFCVASR
ncbi:uncharacterized protein A1O9_12253 [Exophiala aquamarina CBS 119918]|uniref:Cytochrome P450 oxidoreductase n=1 Tax=Exophiala aquamarina CBS 119918 TaxID=1182545 RepID=A0A072NX57_9EURO|nr:uncharacterized protein A1O9_12253 [Exophiala aquamarina CBS 119918]KEF51618.1 hypothetical protein A1O9_12253 [Exophiala aquamarina CBS 119918]